MIQIAISVTTLGENIIKYKYNNQDRYFWPVGEGKIYNDPDR